MKKSTRRRRTGAALSAGVAALAIGAATVPVAHANPGWGAIAYAPNGAWGRALDYGTQAAANQTAVNYCGYTDCRVLVSFDACGAVARTWATSAGGFGPTLAAAEANALAKLGGAWIDSWGCN